MTSKLPTRLARLTLYSGPNCSLCDVHILYFLTLHRLLTISQVAKAELAKIRQTVGTFSGLRWPKVIHSNLPCLQRNFELDVVNIQDPGQEHWRKQYVHWIPALHIDGQEVAKGRWDGRTITQALDVWQKSRLGTPEDSPKKQS